MKRIMTQIRRATVSGETIDLNTCTLDVYEIVIYNGGTATAEIVPFAMSGNPNKATLSAATGIVLNPRTTLRLYAGDRWPRGDQYIVNFLTAGDTIVNFFLYGVPQNTDNHGMGQ